MPNHDFRHRHSIRLQGYDYSQAGAYFVTVCVQDRKCLFGDIANGEMALNDYGLAVQAEWLKTAEIRSEIQLGEFVVMPNHFHGILIIGDDVANIRKGTACRALIENAACHEGTARRAPTERFGQSISGSLPTTFAHSNRRSQNTSTKFANHPALLSGNATITNM